MGKNYGKRFDGLKGYSIQILKKEHKCILCEKFSKSGNTRSSKKNDSKNFICADCLESIIRQYSKSMKTISLNKFIRNKVEWKRKLDKAPDIRKLLDKAPDIKCRLCGAVIKLPQWRGHLAHSHNIGDLLKYRDYFDDEPKQKCRCKICSIIIAEKDWRGHLSKSHNIEKIRFKDFYVSSNRSIQQANKEWYNSDKGIVESVEKDWHCGDVLNGPPRVSLIYNALCTNRRKH